jgi:hypothetical protein
MSEKCPTADSGVRSISLSACRGRNAAETDQLQQHYLRAGDVRHQSTLDITTQPMLPGMKQRAFG